MKSTGPDGIYLLEVIEISWTISNRPFDCNIYNQSVRETSFPSTWKCARIKTIYKKGDTTERENYHPLSILSVPSVVDKLVEHKSENQNLVSTHQWAYKKGLSTELLLVNITEKWIK